MNVVKQTICLLSVVDVFEESANSNNTYLELIEAKLALISDHIYLQSQVFQSAVLNLCEHYIEKNMHSKAVTWFQWFAVEKDIFLICVDETDSLATDKKKKLDDFKTMDTLLAQFHFLEKWSNSYLCFLEQQNTSDDGGISMSHMNIVNKLLSGMNDIIVKWALLPPCTSSSPMSTALASIGSNMQQMGDHLSALSGKHSRRYMALLDQFMEMTSTSPLMNAFRNASGAAFSLDQKQLPSTAAFVQKSDSNKPSAEENQQSSHTLLDFDDELEIYVVGQSSDNESVNADE